MEKWRPRGRPSPLKNGEEGAAPGGRRDPGLEDVGGQDLRRRSGGPGPGREGGDGQHDGRIRPGRRWWPCQEEKSLVREGHSKSDGGPEEEKMPGCRGPGAAGEEMEDGLLGCLRLAGEAEWRRGHSPVVSVGQDVQEAMQEGEVDVHLHSLQGWTLQPRPDVVPGQVPSDPLHQGGGEGAGQLLVDGCRCGQLQVGRVHTGQGKDLAKQGEEVRILARRLPLQSEASGGQGREESLEADPNPVGQVKGRAATSSQVAAGLLGQHGLCPGLRAGEAEATS